MISNVGEEWREVASDTGKEYPLRVLRAFCGDEQLRNKDQYIARICDILTTFRMIGGTCWLCEDKYQPKLLAQIAENAAKNSFIKKEFESAKKWLAISEIMIMAIERR